MVGIPANAPRPVIPAKAGIHLLVVIPAKAGIHLMPTSFGCHRNQRSITWIPAFAGMTTLFEPPVSILPHWSRTPSVPRVAAPVARSHQRGPPPCSVETTPDRRARTLPAARSAPSAGRRESFQPMQADRVRLHRAPWEPLRADRCRGAALSADPRRFQCTVSFL